MTYTTAHFIVVNGTPVPVADGGTVQGAAGAVWLQIWTNRRFEYAIEWLFDSTPGRQDRLRTLRQDKIGDVDVTVYEVPFEFVPGQIWVRSNGSHSAGSDIIKCTYQLAAVSVQEPVPPLTPPARPIDPANTGSSFGAKGLVTPSFFRSLPRPTSKPADDRNSIVLDTPGNTIEGVEVVAGGETILERDIVANGKLVRREGDRFQLAGTPFVISADNVTLRDIRIHTRFTGYGFFVRAVNGFLVDNIAITEGSEFEACGRVAGANGRIHRATIISRRPGLDEKATTTGLRGFTANAWFEGDQSIKSLAQRYEQFDLMAFAEKLAKHAVIIDDFYCEGVINGFNPMVRGDSGPLKGICQLFAPGIMKRPLTRMFEGDWAITGVGSRSALHAVEAFLAARSAGKSRREIVRACFDAMANDFRATLGRSYTEADIDLSIENRDISAGQRAISHWKNGFKRRCKIELQPGAISLFEDVEFEECTFSVEAVSPEVGAFVPGHKNRDWSMEGDLVKPLPRARFINCKHRGRRLDTGWLIGSEISQAAA